MSFFRDLRHACRSLIKSPGLTIVAVFALMLGIGLTTAMFSIVYSVLMKGLPFPEAEQIVAVTRHHTALGYENMSVPIHDFNDYRAQQHSFAALAGSYSGTVNVSGTEGAERFDGSWTSANTFDLLGVRPILGRDFRADEDQPGAARVAILSYSMWRDRYESDSTVIGRLIRANGVPYTVIGVMPDGFQFPAQDRIWMPLNLDALKMKRGEGQQLDVIGRLRPGVSIEQASVDLDGIAKRLATEYKETNDGIGASALPYVESQIGKEPTRLLYTMLGAVGFVLLIACTNVANLLLDRAAHRTKEVGIRTALGASRLTVIRQFLAESLVLSSVGALLGLGLAKIGIVVFTRAIADTQPPSWIDIRLHPPVLLFTVLVAFLASLVAGALPAYQSSRADINEILKDDSRGASSFRIGRMSRVLVIFEIALSCGLLVAAGLMIKSVTRLRTMDPGFRTENMFTARVGFPTTYTDTLRQKQFFHDLRERLAALPGAQSASVSSGLPGVNGGDDLFALEGATYQEDRDYPRAATMSVTPGFMETFDMKVLQGRDFSEADREGALPVAIVNQEFATKYFPGADPLGRRVRMGASRSTSPWLTIIGVVPTTFSGDPEDPHPAGLYLPLAQNYTNFVSMAVHTNTAPMSLTPQVREVVTSLDPDVAIYWVYSMKEALARPLWFVRVFGTMFMILGFIALFLAGVGLYAVMAFSVSRRAREVGIRMALGAQGSHVVRMIFRQGFLQLGTGLVAGLALALLVSNLLQIILFEVKPRDPVVFGAVAAVLGVAGLLACLVPALRAVAVEPATALQSD